MRWKRGSRPPVSPKGRFSADLTATTIEADSNGRASSLPRVGIEAITPQTVAQIVQARAMAAGLGRRDLGGHSLKRGVLTTGMDRGVHPAKLKRLGRHKSFDTLGKYLEFRNLFEDYPLQDAL